MTTTRTVDFVIVGGGVHGCAAAFELARHGADVVLLERNQIASGASGGPGKRGVRANGRDPRELPLMRLAYDIWPTLDDTLHQHAGYDRVGGLELAESTTVDDELAWARVEAQTNVQNMHGIETHLLDRQELDDLHPGLSPTIKAGCYCPKDGVGDHTVTTRAYAAAAAIAGADIREDTTVVAVAEGSVETATGTQYHARHGVLILNNAHAPQLLNTSFGLQLPAWTMAPQVTVFQTDGPPPTGRLISHFTRKLAAKTIGPNQIMLSGGRRGSWDPDRRVGTPDPAVPAASLADGAEVFPVLSSASMVATDASRPEACMVDDIPVIDRVPGQANAYVATGWSGHGFAIAPAVAQLLTNWVRTGAQPEELAPFGLDRLGLSSPART